MSASRRDPPGPRMGFLGLAHLRRMRDELLDVSTELARRYADLVGVWGLGLLIAIGAICAIGCDQRRGLPVATKKCRRIVMAIEKYHDAHGHIPYDERGPEYALYALHDLIDADQFQLRESSNAEQPRWDHESKRLIGGDVVYINQPLTTSKDWGAIIFMRKPTSDETWTDVGRLGFRGWTAKFAATPDRRILGSFETVDEIYVVGRTLFEDLASTHVMSGQSWTTTSDSDHGLIEASAGDRKLRYHYLDGRIGECEIETPRGIIKEEFRTDSLGQVIGVTRSPPNWRQVLGSPGGHKP
jgi:hypothetical protein